MSCSQLLFLLSCWINNLSFYSFGEPPSKLNTETHPFFQGVPSKQPQIKDSFNKLLAVEGNIFSGCNIGLTQYKLFMLEINHGMVIQLEHYKPLTISTTNFSETDQWWQM